LTFTLRRLAYIAFFLETGLLLVVLPWSSFWTRNYFVIHWPAISPWLVNDFVRGGVTGVGVVNLIAGIADIIPLVRNSPGPDSGIVRRSPKGEGG
jgi:hypothetical protein